MNNDEVVASSVPPRYLFQAPPFFQLSLGVLSGEPILSLKRAWTHALIHSMLFALKPDIVIVSQTSQEIVVFELTCPWDTNIARSHNYKLEKYAPLVTDLSHTRVVSYFPIEVSARGQIS